MGVQRLDAVGDHARPEFGLGVGDQGRRRDSGPEDEARVVKLQALVRKQIARTVQAVQRESVSNAARLRLVDTWPAFGGDGSSGHTIGCDDSGRKAPWINDVQFDPQTAILLAQYLSAHASDLRTAKGRTALHDYWSKLIVHDSFAGTFHPRAQGQKAMAKALGATLSWRPLP
jgi:hypothetical protein